MTNPKDRRLAANDPAPKETLMIDMDDPHAMSQLLRVLERQLDKHIDDSRYAPAITIKLDRRVAN